METNTQRSYAPDVLSPPGDTIRDLLEEREMSQAELGERLGASSKHLSQVINGHVPVSAELALGLERVLGPSIAFWLSREARYRAALAKRQSLETLKEHESWARRFPIQELKKRGQLPKEAKGPALVESLLSFLGVGSPEQWTSPAVAYRKSKAWSSDEFALGAWLRLGELAARELPHSQRYDATKFTEAISEARGLTRLDPDEWQPALIEMCAEAGVSVVILEELPKTRANGATQWLSPDHALIQLSIRYRWEDIFWFSFFHEAGHVLKHRKKGVFIEPSQRAARAEADSETQKLEAQADRFAAQTLIPGEHESELHRLTELDEVVEFADDLGIAPAIVIGRLQHERLWAPNKGNELRRRFAFV